MKSPTLTKILSNELNATANNNNWKLPLGTKVTVFLSTPAAVFPVSRIVAISINTDYITLISEEGRIFTDLTEITAIRVDQEAKQGAQGALGF